MSRNEKYLKLVTKILTDHFELRIMEPKNFCGLEIERQDDGSIFIHQTKYIEKIVKKFLKHNVTHNVSIPMEPGFLKTNDTESGQRKVNGVVPYREAIGSLMFAAIVTE